MDGQQAEGEYIFEARAGDSHHVRAFQDFDEAIYFAQQVWNSMPERVQRDCPKIPGARFLVTTRDGFVLHDCLENVRRAEQRKADADRARKDPKHLQEWENELLFRIRIEKTYEYGDLYERGWNGSESVYRLLQAEGYFGEEANDVLDFLTMVTVKEELENRSGKARAKKGAR